MITVKHSGNVGDLIYGLPSVKHIYDISGEPVTYYLNTRWIGSLLQAIIPLLEHQYYIKGTKIHSEEKVDYDLDLFRTTADRNLGEKHLIPFGFPLELINEHSLFLDDNLSFDFPKYDVVINRTSRYLNEKFPWKELLEKYYKNSSKCFIGHECEYNTFINNFNLKNKIDFLRTKNFLEVAWVIKQSSVFIGNCSSPYAIAEVMKHKTIQETCKPLFHCCLYANPKAKYFIDKFATFDEIKKEYLS